MRRLRVGKTNQTTVTTAAGYQIKQDSRGNLGIFRADGTEVGYWTQDRFIFVGQGTNKNLEINLNGQGSPLFSTDCFIYIDSQGNLDINGYNSIYLNNINQNMINCVGPIYFFNKIQALENILTVGIGTSGIFGIDNRKGLTSVDGSPITLYPQGSLGQPAIASGQLYRLSGRILATAGTSPSATYTLKWTEGGAVITKNLSISALDSDSDFSALIQPDANTSITAQLTAISGTGTTVNVAASVERLN